MSADDTLMTTSEKREADGCGMAALAAVITAVIVLLAAMLHYREQELCGHILMVEAHSTADTSHLQAAMGCYP